MFIFKKLVVYQRSIDLATNLTRIAAKFPITYHRISDQLIGAVVSIPLNIAEGNGRLTQKDRNQFYRIAKASAFELVAILDICLNLKLIEKNDWETEIEEISRIISSLIKK